MSMKIKNIIDMLTRKEPPVDKTAGISEQLSGFKVTIPPGKSLLIAFEGRQGSVLADFPITGHPRVEVTVHPDAKAEVTNFNYRPLEPFDQE